MLSKRLIILSCLSTIVSIATLHAATVNYTRSAMWDTAATDDVNGSDTETNSAASLWSYEVIDAPSNPDNRLAGAAPWYQQPSSGSTAWDSNYLRWHGPANTIPRFEGGWLHARLQDGQYGKQPRVAWKAPSEGIASFGGSFGFEAGGGSRNIEWAIAKRRGSTYTLLASGSMNTSTQAEPTYGIGGGGTTPYTFTSAGLTCFLRYPTINGQPVTNRRFPLVMVGHGQVENGANSSTVYEQHCYKGYFIVAPSYRSTTSNRTNAQDLKNVITDLIGRTDLPVQFDRDRIGYSGVSFGGMTGLCLYQADRHDTRIKAIAPRVAMAPSGTYDWAIGTPLLMMNGDDDQFIPYTNAWNTWNDDAIAPKGFVRLKGVGHNQAGAWPILSNGNYGFFGYFLKGETNGLDAITTAANNLALAELHTDWTGAVPHDPISGFVTQIPVANYPALTNIFMEAGDELVWSFRAADLTSPNVTYTMQDQPLTLSFTPMVSATGDSWQKY